MSELIALIGQTAGALYLVGWLLTILVILIIVTKRFGQ